MVVILQQILEKRDIRNLAPNTTYNFSINYSGNQIRSTQQTTDGEGKIHYKIDLTVGQDNGDSSKTIYLGNYYNVVTNSKLTNTTTISWAPA